VIPLDFSSVFTCPRTSRLAQAQALTIGWPPCLGHDRGIGAAVAVDGDELALRDLEHRADPQKEALFELFGAQPGEDVAEGVVRGNSMGQFQKPSEPLDLGTAELLDFNPVVCAADDGADGDVRMSMS